MAGPYTDGQVFAWGDNTYGQLNDGTTIASMKPKRIAGLPKCVQVGMGTGFGVAVDANGDFWTWGYNGQGQLGNGNNTNNPVPTKQTRPVGMGTIVKLCVSDDFTTIIDSNQKIWSWGVNGNKQLADGTTTNRNVPVQHSLNGSHNFDKIETSPFYGTARTTANLYYFWGSWRGVAGPNPMTIVSYNPTLFSSHFGISFATVSDWTAGYYIQFFNRRPAASGIRGTGMNDHGQLGRGTTGPAFGTNATPAFADVNGFSASNINLMHAGGTHVLAQMDPTDAFTPDATYAWGTQDGGKLGNGSFTAATVNSPAGPLLDVLGNPLPHYDKIMAGHDDSSAALDGATQTLWAAGRLNGTNTPSALFQPVPLNGVVDFYLFRTNIIAIANPVSSGWGIQSIKF